MKQIVNKPWGEENIVTENDLPYNGKVTTVLANHKLSLQYHDQITETMCLLSGEAILVLGNDKNSLQNINMKIGEGYTIKPMTIHRLIAITDVMYVEFSTPRMGTTFRLEDDYNRPNENLT